MAQTDPTFRKACALAGVPPSRSQYRKFRYGRGKVARMLRETLDSNQNGVLNAK